MFASDDLGLTSGLLPFLFGGALTALGGSLTWFLTWWATRSDKVEERKDARAKVALEEWQEIVRRQDANISNLGEQLRQSQNGQEECRSRELVLQRNIVRLHSCLSKAVAVLKEHKMAVDELPPLEDFIPPVKADDLMSQVIREKVSVRQTLQATELIRAEARHAGASYSPPPDPASEEGPKP